jgi:hypothetical protein
MGAGAQLPAGLVAAHEERAGARAEGCCWAVPWRVAVVVAVLAAGLEIGNIGVPSIDDDAARGSGRSAQHHRCTSRAALSRIGRAGGLAMSLSRGSLP